MFDGVLPDGTLLGARGDGGVQIRKPDYAPFSAKLRVRIATDKANAIYAAARSQIGKPYDYEAIAAFAFDRNWRATDHWFCSEYWAWSIETGLFFPHPLLAEVNRITPVDLVLLMSPFAEVIA